MQYFKPLALLLASAWADHGEDHVPVKNSYRRLSLIRTASSLEAQHDPRKKEKLETHSNKGSRDQSPFTHKSLEQIHPVHRDQGKSKRYDNTPKRHLRTSSQRITMETVSEQKKSCLGIRKIVRCKDNVPEEVCKEALVQTGVVVLSDMPKTVFFAICVDSEAEAIIVAALTDVKGVEDDPPRTLSVMRGSTVERRVQTLQQVTPYGIDLIKAPEFWSRYNGNQGAGIKVCIIDTGLRASHEDMQGGDITGSEGPDLVNPWSEDGASHGTHVAGTIAARDNNQGVVGVAPQASLHIVRVFDGSGQFTASNLIVAMNACADANANIISMSLGGPIDTFAERSAIRTLHERGLLMVAASGNDANGNNFVEYPAGYEFVLSVAAVDQLSQVADFSTYNTEVDIAAPGVDVLSLSSSDDRAYASASGTSMAAPHVAGVAALVWSQFPDKSVSEIEQALTESARDLGACGKDRLSGHGLVDAVAAAIYLEGGGGASENGDCVAINVSLKTDDYGSETTYLITSDGDLSDIVYRGGPYTDNERSTYLDSISLPDGCYSLLWLDKYGDGSSNPSYGLGEIALDYGGSRQVSSDSLSGAQESFRFGSCVSGGADPTPPPVSAPVVAPVVAPVSAPVVAPVAAPVAAPVVAPVAAPVTAPVVAPVAAFPSPTQPQPSSPPQSSVTSECGADESLLQLSVTTDSWSRSENHLYLFEASAPDDEFLWSMPRFSLSGNTEYEGVACVKLEEECTKFYFFDEFGDGLESGNLTLSLDGVVVLQVLPGDQGDVFQEGEPATFWFQDVGNCPSTSEFNRAM